MIIMRNKLFALSLLVLSAGFAGCSNDDEEEIYSENVPEKRHKKIFTQDDGEYVDFEEIK